jgi:NADPH:quinone reductase-like Zn-dependent oxidoreductase
MRQTFAVKVGSLAMQRYLLLLAVLLPLIASAQSYQQIVITEFGDADTLQLVTQRERPEPTAGEVRIRVLTASASFTDVMVRKGMYAEAPTEPPLVPGYDLVGIVDKLGAGVSGLRTGQRVADLTVWGAYTEYAVRPASGLVPVPQGLSDEAAVALILSYTTAYQMLHRIAKVKPGQTVLIHGASGAVGTALAQLAKAADVKTLGTASTLKQGYLKSLSVQAIDYKTEDFVSRTAELSNGAGVDFTFDAIGVDNFKRSYETLTPDGELVLYGLYSTTLSGKAGGRGSLIIEFLRLQLQLLLWKWFPDEQKTAVFYSITELRTQHPDWFRKDLGKLFKMATAGEITPQIWKVMPLSKAAAAHRFIEERAVTGKIVLRVAP